MSDDIAIFVLTLLGFGGWYKDAKCTKPITSIAPGKKSNTTVYAKWTKISQ